METEKYVMTAAYAPSDTKCIDSELRSNHACTELLMTYGNIRL